MCALLRTLMSLAKRGRRSANTAVVVAFPVAPDLAPATYTMWFGVAVSTCGAMSTWVRLVGKNCVLHMTTSWQLRCSL